MKQRPLIVDFAGVFGALVLLIAIYLSGYYALLEGKRLDHRLGSGIAMANKKFVPKYRVISPAVSVAFYPANQLDRVMRNHYWNTLLGWHELSE